MACAAEIEIPQQDIAEIGAAGEGNEFLTLEDTIDWASLWKEWNSLCCLRLFKCTSETGYMDFVHRIQ